MAALYVHAASPGSAARLARHSAGQTAAAPDGPAAIRASCASARLRRDVPRRHTRRDMTTLADDTEARIAGFLAKYTPAIEADLRAARARLRARFPRGHELVFDNWNALVFGISPSTRSRESFVSVAGYPRWVTLFFLDGASLDDPQGLLEGEGKQVRGVRLARPEDIDSPGVAALLEQATRPWADALAVAPPLATTIHTVADKQRPRRPAGR